MSVSRLSLRQAVVSLFVALVLPIELVFSMLRKALVFVLNIEKVGERVGQFLGPMCSFEVWSSSMAQVRILVVDDEPIFRRELARFLLRFVFA